MCNLVEEHQDTASRARVQRGVQKQVVVVGQCLGSVLAKKRYFEAPILVVSYRVRHVYRVLISKSH